MRGSRRGDSERARTHEQAKQDHPAGVGVVKRETPRHGCRPIRAAANRLRRATRTMNEDIFACFFDGVALGLRRQGSGN